MQPADQNLVRDESYSRIVKSTTVIGGSSAVNVVFKIIQSKAAAVLIGPAGFGLMGIFNAILGVATSLAGMGFSTSGVRQIAEAAVSGDEARIARTVTVFQRAALFFGVLGALLFFILRRQITQLTFGSDERSAAVGALAIVVLLTVISSAQSALIRGMRRVGDLARVTVIGIAIGTVLGIPLLVVWGVQGIVPYLILAALTTLLVSWFYARKIPIAKVPLTWKDISGEARSLLSLGVVFMVSGLITMAATYLVQVMVLRKLGLDSTGLYEASSNLSSVYVNFILVAMGADFFPHLASVSRDDARSEQLINAQAEVGLLIATPGILAVLALGPYLFRLFYSAHFVAAFEILRWQTIGMFLSVISWPVSFIMLARSKGSWFFWSGLVTNLFYLGATEFCISLWGLSGIGMAFLAMNIFYLGLVILVAHRLIRFRWSGRNLRLTLLLFPAILVAFLATLFFTPLLSAAVGLVLAVGVSAYSLKALYALVGPAAAQAYWQRIKTRLGWSKA